MAITIAEQWTSPDTTITADGGERITSWVVMGTADQATAEAAVLDYVPAVYAGLYRQRVRLVAHGATSWLAEIRYGPRKPLSLGEARYEFDTTGGTQRIKQSLETVGAYALPDETAPNYHGAIGVTESGVEGVDITVPVFAWSETHVVAAAEITSAYRQVLYALTGRVNDAAWRDYDAGEVLFLGARGGSRNADEWDMTYRFAASPNIGSTVIGGITVAAKGGWQYLWYRYKQDVDEDTAIERPQAAYVERVYRSGSFLLLGLGT